MRESVRERASALSFDYAVADGCPPVEHSNANILMKIKAHVRLSKMRKVTVARTETMLLAPSATKLPLRVHFRAVTEQLNFSSDIVTKVYETLETCSKLNKDTSIFFFFR